MRKLTISNSTLWAPYGARKIHELKTWPKSFERVVTGLKNFEVRKNDRDFKVGDFLFLREYDPETKQYSGRFQYVRVTYILGSEERSPVPNALHPDYVIMAVSLSWSAPDHISPGNETVSPTRPEPELSPNRKKGYTPVCGDTKAPEGWYCTREKGHEGPCAAVYGYHSDGKKCEDPNCDWQKRSHSFPGPFSEPMCEFTRPGVAPKAPSAEGAESTAGPTKSFIWYRRDFSIVHGPES